MDGLELTKDEAYSLVDFLDVNLIHTIHNDPDVDSMQWLCNIVHAYEKLAKYSGYNIKTGV